MSNWRKGVLVLFALLILLFLALFLNAAQNKSKQLCTESIKLQQSGVGKEKVKFAVDEQAALERMSQSIRFRSISHGETISPEEEDSHKEFDLLLAFLERSYPKTFGRLQRDSLDCHSILLKWQGSDNTMLPILLASHLDVVPVEQETEDQWTHDPWNGTIIDGYIWGRGTLDDKIGVIGILEAVEALLNANYKPRRTIYIAFGHDEEVSGKNGAQKIVSRLEKQGIKLEYVLDEGGSITEGMIEGVTKPVAVIGIAEKGFVTLKLNVTGPGGHSSMPDSETPIGILAGAVYRVESNQLPVSVSGAFRETLEFIAPEVPWLQRTVFSNLWFFSPLIKWQMLKTKATASLVRTTTAVTIFHGGLKDNVLPKSAMAHINFRIVPGESVQSVYEHTKRVINDDRVSIEVVENSATEPSLVSPTNSHGWHIVQATIQSLFPDVIVAPYLTMGATDGRYYHALTPNVYRFIPYKLLSSDVPRLHGVNERVSVQDFLKSIKFYGDIILNSQTHDLSFAHDEL